MMKHDGVFSDMKISIIYEYEEMGHMEPYNDMKTLLRRLSPENIQFFEDKFMVMLWDDWVVFSKEGVFVGVVVYVCRRLYVWLMKNCLIL